MNGMRKPMSVEQRGELRLEIARLRQELLETTEAYRLALANRDSGRTIPLLRSRSRLMRRLLDTECELLLSMRTDTTEPSSAVLARSSSANSDK